MVSGRAVRRRAEKREQEERRLCRAIGDVRTAELQVIDTFKSAKRTRTSIEPLLDRVVSVT